MVDGFDLRSLPLSPIEGFVVSRVDGNATIGDLADLTSLDSDEVDRIVAKLVELGAVEWADGTVSLPSPSRRPSVAPAGPRGRGFAPPVPNAAPPKKVVASESPPPMTTREPLSPPPPRQRRPSQPFNVVFSQPPTDVIQGVRRDARGAEVKTPGMAPIRIAQPPLPQVDGASPAEEDQLELIPDPSTVDALAGIDLAALEAALADSPEPSRGAEAATAPEAAPALDASAEGASAGVEASGETPPSTDAAAASGETPPSTDAAAASAAPEDPAPSAQPASSAEQPAPSAEQRAERTEPAAEEQPDPPAAGASENEATPGESAPPADGIELDAARRKKIDDLFVVLELLDHYEVLGLKRNADKTAVKKAYFGASKLYHPDTLFRKNLGPYKAKMEAIFTRLTEAYDVLGKKRAREEYDAYLAMVGGTAALEALSEVGVEITPDVLAATDPAPGAKARPVASEPPKAPLTPTPPSSAPPTEPPRARSEEAKQRARELMHKRLAGVRGASMPTRPAASAGPVVSTAAPERSRSDVIKDLARALKSTASVTGGLDQLQRLVLDARRAADAGDLASAVKSLRTAVAMAPDRDDIRERYQTAARALASELAERYEQQAVYEERHRKWAAAALSWAKVVEGRPDDARAHIHAANALVEAAGDLHAAAKLAQRAVELEPEGVVARRTLGKVYVAAGLQLNARRELEKAASLDPSDELVKNLLREISTA